MEFGDIQCFYVAYVNRALDMTFKTKGIVTNSFYLERMKMLFCKKTIQNSTSKKSNKIYYLNS